MLVVLGLFEERCEVLLFDVLTWWLVDKLMFMFAVLMFALFRTDGGSFGCGGGVGGSGGNGGSWACSVVFVSVCKAWGGGSAVLSSEA